VEDGGGSVEGVPRRKRRRVDREHGIGALPVTYSPEKARLEKASDIIGFEREGSCTVCKNDLEHDGGVYTICPSPGCESVTHITCLSKHFLASEPEALVPIKGTCPSCQTEVRWVEVVKELSLRMRGQKHVEKLLRVKRVRKEAVEDCDVDEDDDEALEDAIYEKLKSLKKSDPEGKMEGDQWNEAVSGDSDAGSVASAASVASLPKKTDGKGKKRVLPSVIEDSDWDDALSVD